jgi:hypothetical protein
MNNARLHIVYWVLLLDGQTELETLRKIRKTKCIPTLVDVLWHRSRGDYDLHAVALELMFEVCRSERLSEEDLGTFPLYHLNTDCITEGFVEFLLSELEEDYDESYNMCICRLIVTPHVSRLKIACIERTIHGHYECGNISTSVPSKSKFPTITEN